MAIDQTEDQQVNVLEAERETLKGNVTESETNGREPVHSQQKKGKKFILFFVPGILLIGVVAWQLLARNYETTDDAQVDSHMNPIASRIEGTIQAVHIEDNQTVHAGQLLVELDPRDNQVALTQAKADRDQALAQSTAERPNLPITLVSNNTDETTGRAEVANAEAALAVAQHDYDNAVAKSHTSEANNARAQSDLKRYAQLVEKQEVAQSDYDQYLATAKSQESTVEADKAAVASAAKTVEQRQAQLLEQKSRLDRTLKIAKRQISIQEATIQSRQASAESSEAKLDQAKLNLAYTQIVAPVNGILTQRSAEVGARISAGQQLMMIVQTDDLWVTANFKETQLRRMRNGQPVRIHVDSLDKDFDGYVENMPAATGDRTSVLPPENATGNYVKVIQRLPVRIRFRPNQYDLDKLRPGMSVEPKVHLE
jgi:membrane fusion protein, multidrug efflux system